MLFIHYPKCSTCAKAKQWLDEHNLVYTERHIKEYPPAAAELTDWHTRSGKPLYKFFNTSGMLYRELNLKEKLPALTDAEQYELLASDGMLVKRPLLIHDSGILIGFKEAEWAATLLPGQQNTPK
ncbi:MAG: arsenate reductase family protein [Treponema sp.]